MWGIQYQAQEQWESNLEDDCNFKYWAHKISSDERARVFRVFELTYAYDN